MASIVDDILGMKVKKQGESYLLNKPLLVLFALGRLKNGETRMAPFFEYEKSFKSIEKFFGDINVLYPFGRLIGDGFWEIPDLEKLSKTSSGDLIRSELIKLRVFGGFKEGVFDFLLSNRKELDFLIDDLLKKFIPENNRLLIVREFKLHEKGHYCMENEQLSLDVGESGLAYGRENFLTIENNSNGFVSYVNSLHNINASGANALAESQVLSKYFYEMYEPFPLIDELVNFLKNEKERVVILTGHAGDGKSTVAFDVLKKLRGLPADQPLVAAIRYCEEINSDTAKVSIVKDMSELSAKQRSDSINKAFAEPGSWLIVSNTGPLLNSLTEYADSQGLAYGVESDILGCLSEDFDGSNLEENRVLNHFQKPLLILNLTRLDNVSIGSKILRRLVEHSGWGECNGCALTNVCPLLRNQQALHASLSVVEQRVRWIYQRLNAYEQRLTLRQMVAQLAWALTGGKSCTDIYKETKQMASNCATRSIGEILFSEGFFGYHRGKRCERAGGLQAIKLTQRVVFGAPINVRFERLLVNDAGAGWGKLPNELEDLIKHWQGLSSESAGVNWRFALRRALYVFGQVMPDKQNIANQFFDGFLQSPSLREFDSWQTGSDFAMDSAEYDILRNSCLHVLLEAYSGFNISQFNNNTKCLYITLRRPNQSIVQLTQIVIKPILFDDFELYLNPKSKMLCLAYLGGSGVSLDIGLPLLDYIRARDRGELGNNLSPVYQAKIDWYREALLRATSIKNSNRKNLVKFDLLRVGVAGNVSIHSCSLDKMNKKLIFN